ncbi:NAD(+) diphosphatase [Clostridium carnis]
MNYCFECGTKLINKKCNDEGEIPYCNICEKFHFPTFSSAISVIILNPDKNKVLLIQQYGRVDNILVAGYINKGEDSEQTLVREVKEEIGLEVKDYQYMKSRYFERTNTLMCNFICTVDSEDLSKINNEIDKTQWFTFKDAVKYIKSESLAEEFLIYALKKLNYID